MSQASLVMTCWSGIMAVLMRPAPGRLELAGLVTTGAAVLASVLAGMVEAGSLESGRGSRARRPLQVAALAALIAHLAVFLASHFLILS